MTDKPLQIRNNTADFLVFTAQADEQGIEVRFEDKTVWLTQQMTAELFQLGVPAVSQHLKNIFERNALGRGSVVRNLLNSAAAPCARQAVVKSSLTTAATAAHCGCSPEGTPDSVLPTGWVSR
jgi:hypothetical protein